MQQLTCSEDAEKVPTHTTPVRPDELTLNGGRTVPATCQTQPVRQQVPLLQYLHTNFYLSFLIFTTQEVISASKGLVSKDK